MPSDALNNTEQTDALMELMAPDGYYTYLGLEKNVVVTPPAEGSSGSGLTPKVGEIDKDAVKKAYRKLSRKHHPDKGGDADTFKALARAYRVLLNPKLREQYDVLGIDLDDDVTTNNHNDQNGGDASEIGEDGDGTSSTAQGIVHDIASMTLTGIIQLSVRTGMFCGFVRFVESLPDFLFACHFFPSKSHQHDHHHY